MDPTQSTLELLLLSEKLAHVGSWRWDLQRNTVFLSDELIRILGIELSGNSSTFETLMAYLHPDDRSRVDAMIQQSLADKQPFRYEARFISTTHHELTIRVQAI